MKNKYNEKLYGELIYNNGFQTNYIKSELTLLVKYLKQVKNLSKKDTEKFLYDFCKKYIEDFNEVQYFKVIDSAIRKGRKQNNKLIVIENIPILKSELEYIDKLDIGHEYKKLLLSFIVQKKINLEIHKMIDEKAELSAYFGGSNKKYREVFKMANISNKYKINEMINELVSKGILLSIIKGDIVLEYMYSIYNFKEEKKEKSNEIRKHIIYEVEQDDIYEEISNFENIGYVFDYYKGDKKVKRCEECGDYIKIKNNKQKYCDGCAKEIKKKQDKIADDKYKKRQKRENRNIL